MHILQSTYGNFGVRNWDDLCSLTEKEKWSTVPTSD